MTTGSTTLPTHDRVPSANLVATWLGHALFLWARAGTLEEALAELPGSAMAGGRRATRPVALPRTRTLRLTVDGLECDVGKVLPLLAALPTDVPVSDAVRCWSLAAKFALELAAANRVVPTVRDGEARWIAVVARPQDRERFQQLVLALPAVGRSAGLDTTKPSLRDPLSPSRHMVRSFLDRAVDAVFRTGVYAGPARGWALDFATALRGDDPRFAVRDARAQATPERIAAWAARAEALIPRIGFALDLPNGKDGKFPLRTVVHRNGDPHTSVPVAKAWKAGKILEIGGVALIHPAEAVIRGLARAARIFPRLSSMLTGPAPTDLRLDAAEAWTFLDAGRVALEGAGFAVLLPDAFERAGRQRIRTRIRLTMTGKRLDLSGYLTYRWEILVGDQVLDPETFAALVAEKRPIVRFQGDWVFLDPDELARLPKDLSSVGSMSGPEALHALLTGVHDGVPVVADERLSDVLQALREPPERPPPKGLVATLRPYQARGYAWLAALGGLGLGALLADDMGLGKTVQLVAYLLCRREQRTPRAPRRSLVVCPTSVLGNWQRELGRFAPSLSVVRWHGLDRDLAAIDDADVVLTTYGLLVRDADALAGTKWDVVALDEAQSIKNPDSRRARAARRIEARHRVALTGTPVENRLDELWSVMEFLVPGLLGARATFQRKLALPIERFGDPEAQAELKRTVAPFLLRRTKTDPTVVADLPEKVERREYCPLTVEQRALYEKEVQSAMAAIASSEDLERRGRVLAMLTALKQICNHPYQFLRKREPEADPTLAGRSGKLDRITEVVESIAACGERAVLFTQYREMGELLQDHLQTVLNEPVPFLHGGTPAQTRDAMVHEFQSEDAADGPVVLIVSLKAGGTGLTLTRATHVIHYDRWWNPAVEDQATDRAHRIGQKQTVVVHKLVCEGTLEERIDGVLEEKRELFDAVVGTGERWVTELDDAALLKLVLLSPS